MQTILFTNNVSDAIRQLVDGFSPSSTFIITDTNVSRDVLPLLGLDYPVITVANGDENKNLDSLSHIWDSLIKGGATRKSLVVNIGGGVVTDMGGFAAATFKRGIRFINVPTTLLSAVDAAVGGKTGINFNGFKNEIGAFAPADAVIISTRLFASLPPAELLSGYAEMLKHGLLSSAEAYTRLLKFDILDADLDRLLPLLEESVKVKEKIVEEDPHEKGIRRALNLGHTAGHAFESHAIHRGQPIPHGHAVAYGMLVEMILSHMLEKFPSGELYRYASYLKAQGYGRPSITCDDYETLITYMRHDKKNDTPDSINFTLLSAPGKVLIDRTAGPKDIKAALDIFRDLLG
ncbi:MAG: 3-dehydroquinate synthase [Staphylococcus sp.]|nr:3-dehydroquinate synthase [Staphylococcus sp.]